MLARFVRVLFVGLLLSGCQSGVLIEVSVIGRPIDAGNMIVTAELNSIPASGTQTVFQAERFRVAFSEVLSGLLKLHVSAQDLSGCDVAAGEGAVQIDGPGNYTLAIDLLPAQGCSLTVEVIGSASGSVSSNPTGLDCGTHCFQQYVRGQIVTLAAKTSDSKELFGGWFADSADSYCAGRAVCTIKVGSGMSHVRAQFIKQDSCTPNGWCVEENVPSVVSFLYGLWGSQRDDVWIVGDGGSMLHGDGITWSTVPQVTSKALRAVWGSSSSDVWAVGETGTILHFDGAAWSVRPKSGTSWLLALWGSGRNDVWAVGDYGTALHWDGTSWSSVATGSSKTLRGIWGSGSTDIWVVGDAGTLLHWDGLAFSAQNGAGTTASLYGVWGTGASNVWMVGDGGTVLHLSGLPSTFTMSDSKSTASLHSVFGTSPSQIWAVGVGGVLLQWNGTGWTAVATKFPNTATLLQIWGSDPQDIWAVGQSPTILRYRP